MTTRPTLTRRQALGWLTAAGVGTALAGCRVQTAPDATGAEGLPPIELPDAKGALPTGEATLRWLDGGGNRTLFLKPLFEAYQAKHPNLRVQYDATNMDTVNETVPLGVRNGTAPDVFAIGNKIEHRTAIQSGWCRPLDDIVPDFAAWRDTFPANSMVPNEHVVDGRTYSFPLFGSGEITEMMIYSVGLLEQAGVDPTRDLGTWDQFRAASKKIADAGQGTFYGLMNSRTPVKIVEGLLATAGWRGPIDYRTGRHVYTEDVVVDVVELVQAMKADGSIWPDFAGISAADARGRMPNEVAGLQVDGPFSFAEWAAAGWNFGVQLLPTPEAGGTYTDTYSYAAGGNVFAFAKTEQTQIIGDLFSYLGSLEGQTQMVIQSRGALLPSLPDAQQAAIDQGADIDPAFTQVREMSKSIMRSGPEPVVRTADVSMVEPVAVKPAFADILGGILTGQVTDVRGTLQKLNDDLDRGLDEAIAKAREAGAQVSREDYVFADWDPSTDYTTQPR